ncbi:energy-coupling factor transporter transmembrane component T family protein [Sporolactobacillus pectinivorans]|uniref:energy-coupling factor transporter transmembrane component T family protein n=1 Tax=Sporolactobacillus pectinivorans TaxID=1591408 RepID=UPI000C260F30|nr:energy-coupling factor transporter transmembrane component T [Sporolactobacillus pectinivorans]
MSQFFFHNLIGQTILGYLLMFMIPALIPLSFMKLVGIKGLRNMLSYEGHDTIIHRLDPRLKVLFPVIIGLLSVFLNWSWVFALCLVSVIPWLLVKPSKARIRVVIAMSIIPAFGQIWSQGILYNTNHDFLFLFPWTLSWTGHQGLSVQGLQYGLQQTGRFLCVSLASLLLMYTAEPAEIIWACMKLKMPVKLGFALSSGLRFLPLMFEKFNTLVQAMEVRGYDFSHPDKWWQLRGWVNYLKRFCMALPVLTVPLFINSLRGTHTMAMVADARAFGANAQRGSLTDHTFTLEDKLAWAYVTMAVLGVVVVIMLGVGLRGSGN